MIDTISSIPLVLVYLINTNVNRYFGGVCQSRTDYFRAWDLQSRPLPSGPHTNRKPLQDFRPEGLVFLTMYV